ncbi:hypothetical protein RTBOTA2_000680 [Rhodotorula toruloides]|nr:hypothetical protein RTBOTA2_000680 [Rhodotorula toruloides]
MAGRVTKSREGRVKARQSMGTGRVQHPSPARPAPLQRSASLAAVADCLRYRPNDAELVLTLRDSLARLPLIQTSRSRR